MDYSAAIKHLRSELDKVNRAIAELASLTSPDGLAESALQPRKRRGRKSMGPEERQIVSERFKRYWAKRRMQKK